MKNMKKVVMTALCAAMLVAGSVMGTMAYLTSQDTVTNTFTVGNVKITMDEAQVDENGKATDPASRVQANTYKLQPAHSYTKDPVVHVQDKSEKSILFVKVENKIPAGLLVADGENDTIEAQMTANGWATLEGVNDVYYHKNVQAANTDVKVFQSFKVSDKAYNEDGKAEDALNLNNIKEAQNNTIVVTAYAIQADGLDKDTDGTVSAEEAETAWTGIATEAK